MLSLLSGLTVIALLFYYAFCWATRNNDYFAKRGVRHMKPVFLVGNNGGAFAGKYTVPEFAMKIYNQFPGEK